MKGAALFCFFMLPYLGLKVAAVMLVRLVSAVRR